MAGGFFSGASDLAVSGGVAEAQDFANDAEQAEANAAASATAAANSATAAANSATAAANSAANVTVTYTSVERYFGDTTTIQHMSDPDDGIGVIDFGVVSGSINTTQLADNGVNAAKLNVSGNGTSGQYLESDGDGSFSWATPSGGTISDGGTVAVTLSATSAEVGDTQGAITITVNFHPQPSTETISNAVLTVHNSADNSSSNLTLSGTGNTRTATFTPATTSARTYTFNAAADFNLSGTPYHHTGKATFRVTAAPVAGPTLYSYLSTTAPSGSNSLSDFTSEGDLDNGSITDTFTANNTSRDLYYISTESLTVSLGVFPASVSASTISISSTTYNVYEVNDFDDSQNGSTFTFTVAEA